MADQASGNGEWPRAILSHKVLRADLAERLHSLDRYAAAIDSHAREIVEDAERIRTRRWQEGYAAGLAEGRRVILEEVLRQREAALAMLAELENSAVSLVIDATRRIIGELDDAEAITRMVDLSLAELRPFRTVAISVPPALLHRLKTPLRQLVERRLEGANVEITGSDDLTGSECRIATEGGFLQLSIEDLLAALQHEIGRQTDPDGRGTGT